MTLLFMILGTMLAFSPFLRRPQRWGDYMLPRYVVPVVFWLTGFLPVITRAIRQDANMMFEDSRAEYQGWALMYLTFCLAMFRLGIAIPVRSQRLGNFAENLSLDLNPTTLRVMAVLLVTVNTLLLFMTRGFGVLDERWASEPIQNEVLLYLQRFIMPALSVISVATFGLGWPESKGASSALAWVGAVYVLTLATAPLASSFSRGTGMMPLIMLVGYVVRHRRVPAVAAILAVMFLIYAGAVGLAGRGVMGHNAGLFPYARQFFTGGIITAQESVSATLAGDSLTPLSVSMAVYYERADVGQLSPLGWLLYQIPVPHMFGIGGEYTLDLTWYVGGQGTWGYTASMFGDTFVHLGWWGSLAFVYMGIMYRLLENVIRQKSDEGLFSNILALAAMPIAYAALAYGCFNTYRSWNSSFTFGLGLIVIFLWLLRRLVPRTGMEYATPALGQEASM